MDTGRRSSRNRVSKQRQGRTSSLLVERLTAVVFGMHADRGRAVEGG